MDVQTEHVEADSIVIEGLSDERLEYLWNEVQRDQARMISRGMQVSFEATAINMGDVEFQSASRNIDPEKEERAERISNALFWA